MAQSAPPGVLASSQSGGCATCTAGLRSTLVCSHCGAEYPSGARFCHICGSDRDPRPPVV